MVAQQLVRVRNATQKDMQVVLDVEHKCFPDPYPLSLLNQLHVNHPDSFLIAEVDRKIVGYVIGALRWGKIGHILAIAADPPYQRQRIGSILMKNVLDRLRAKGAKRIRLEARKSNRVAQQFYLKLGFRLKEEIPYYYENGETAVAMEYELKG